MNEHNNNLKEDPQELQNKEIQGKKVESVVCQNVDFLVSTLNPKEVQQKLETLNGPALLKKPRDRSKSGQL